MISSGALPKVTFRSPPMPGPERAASSSVARLISAAVGMIPSAAVKKTATGLAPAMSSASAIGMNGTRRYGQSPPASGSRFRIRPSTARTLDRGAQTPRIQDEVRLPAPGCRYLSSVRHLFTSAELPDDCAFSTHLVYAALAWLEMPPPLDELPPEEAPPREEPRIPRPPSC